MEKNNFKTHDLSIAAYLLATGQVNLSGTEKEGRDVIFLFSPRQKAEELVRLYWGDQAPAVQPRQLFQSLRSLKDLIFSGG